MLLPCASVCDSRVKNKQQETGFYTETIKGACFCTLPFLGILFKFCPLQPCCEEPTQK
jgi:hypothetical protein